MRRAGGFAVVTDRETGAAIKEADTYTCSHCSRIVHVKPFCDPANLGAHCRLCDKLICPKCAYLMSLGKPCIPFIERVQRVANLVERGYPFVDPMKIQG